MKGTGHDERHAARRSLGSLREHGEKGSSPFLAVLVRDSGTTPSQAAPELHGIPVVDIVDERVGSPEGSNDLGRRHAGRQGYLGWRVDLGQDRRS